jgi:DNA-binding IclR family transcriptional regulator
MSETQAFPTTPEYGAVPQYPIESVDNALRVLVLLGERPQLRLTDVSQYLGVASSTAHRVLAMLCYRGLVRQNAATRSYEPGPSLDHLAFGLLRRLDVRSRARPTLEKLNADLQETVHLGRLEGGDVHFIDSIESTRALRVVNRLGRSMPAHCTSTGKALLATLSEEELLAVYPDEELRQLTRHSIGTRTELMVALAEIRRRGYATSQEESEEGVQSLAVSLRALRSPRLALCASVPISRMTASTRKTIREHLIESAEAIDQLLP